MVSEHVADLPDAAAERARYETHQNLPHDPGYRGFLARMADPLSERVEPGASGLDYGCGPGPTLALMLRERGYAMDLWDPYFAPDMEPLERQYDFVTCTETVEHFHFPAKDYHRLRGLVRPGGWLGIMTEVLGPDIDLSEWWYARDPTHVALHRSQTFRWLSQEWGWTLEFEAPGIVFLNRPVDDMDDPEPLPRS